MSTVNIEKIATSVCNQLKMHDQRIVSIVKNTVTKKSVSSYEDVKKLSLTLKSLLYKNNLTIANSNILNVLSKALGYTNHHEYKHKNDSKKANTISITSDDGSNLRKLFKDRREIFSKHGEDKWDIILTSNYPHELILKYDTETYSSIVKMTEEEMANIAFTLVKHYKNFFFANWRELSNQDFPNANNLWPVLSYKTISMRGEFIFVDDYSCDTHWHIIANFADYVLRFGSIEDVEIFESIINRRYKNPESRVKSLGELSTIYDWEEFILSRKTKFTGDLRETLEAIKYINLDAQSYMLPHLNAFEKQLDSNMKEIIIDACVKLEKTNSFHALDYFANLLFDTTIEKINQKLEDTEDLELYKKRHDLRNTLTQLVNYVDMFLKNIKN